METFSIPPWCTTNALLSPGHEGFLCYLVGAWVSIIGAVVGMTASLLATWAAVGTCLGCLVGIFLVLADREGVFADPATISVLFALLIATCLAISWFKVGLKEPGANDGVGVGVGGSGR